MRQYRASPKGHRRCMIADWKYVGLKGDYDYIYDRFMATTHCDLCQTLVTKGKKGGREKQMEHDHSTGQFRNVTCAKCNSQKTDRKIQIDNTSGHKGVSYQKRKNLWVYRKQIDGKTICKRKKNKIQLLCIKFAILILYRKQLVN